jgi:hypothetical protein
VRQEPLAVHDGIAKQLAANLCARLPAQDLEALFRLLWVLGGPAAGESDVDDTGWPETGGKP